MGRVLRAPARPFGAAGHSRLAGKRSARYSAIASVSHTTRPSSTSTGTRPAGVRPARRCLKADSGVKASKRTITSSNGMPACFISTQGRIDQDE